jgi:protein TonB
MKIKSNIILVLLFLSTIAIAQNNNQNFMQGLNKSVGENFDIKMAKKLGLPVGKVRIMVSMRVDSLGNFKAKAKAPHKKLEAEAVRVVNEYYVKNKEKLNKNGVGMCYSLPIQFAIEKKQK